MNTSKIIFVTGGTGNQGGAVAKNLLHNGFTVKVLTRNPESANAQNLKRLNAEIIKGDLDMPDTFSNHLKSVDGISPALVGVPPSWRMSSPDISHHHNLSI